MMAVEDNAVLVQDSPVAPFLLCVEFGLELVGLQLLVYRSNARPATFLILVAQTFYLFLAAFLQYCPHSVYG